MSCRIARRLRTALSLCVVVASLTVGSALAQDARALKAVDQWLASYLAGKLELDAPRINKSSPGVRSGIVPEDRAPHIGHLEELDAICRAIATTASADAAEHLLNVAAIGLDRGTRAGVDQRPQLVRRTGEQWLDRLDGLEVAQAIEAVAKNDRASGGLGVARRAAALLALGRKKDEVFRPTLELGLAAEDEEIRLAAAEACGASLLKTTLPPLIGALGNEKDEVVLIAGFDAMLAIVRQFRENVDQDVLRRIADVAQTALGRASWRSDLAAVELLDKVRSAQSVPALIEVLGRFAASFDGTDDGRSGLLKERTHEVLISLTGARFAAERPDQWREWWASVRDTFQVAELKAKDAAEPGRTTTGDFFGIPVRGSRVLFVVDCSGSMAEGWRGPRAANGTTTGNEAGEQKIDVARRELLKAVEQLTADCQFNLVAFGNGAKVWQKDMVPADAKNKKRFAKLVEELRADGGTNLWQGLRDGLKLESLVYGSRYGATYDQLFVLSDGLPTLGDVQSPKEILVLVKETNRYSRLRIDTVYIAGDPQAEKRAAEIVGMGGAEFMRRLAEENGGTAVGF